MSKDDDSKHGRLDSRVESDHGKKHDDSSFESEDENSKGKFFLIDVPDFKPDTPTPLRSYLRLGTASRHAGDPRAVTHGEDLASLVVGFTDDTRDRGADLPEPHGDGSDPHRFDPVDNFPSDFDESNVSKDPNRAPGHGLSLSVRKGISDDLHKKGGWRDHSDGNRITTTNGDKVEVIRGNYKLLVLGRQATDLKGPKKPPRETEEEKKQREQNETKQEREQRKRRANALKNASVWEASGGKIDDADAESAPEHAEAPQHAEQPGHANEDERSVQPQHGAGQERAGHANEKERSVQLQAHLEIAYSWVDELGPRWRKVEREGEQHVDDAVGNSNPVLEEYKYAWRIKEVVGDPHNRVQAIDEQTYAVAISELVDAKSLTETRTVEGSITETTKAGSLSEYTHVDQIAEIKTVGLELGMTLAVGKTEVTIAGLLAEATIAAAVAEMTAAMAKFEINLIPTEYEIHEGTKFEVHGGHLRTVVSANDVLGVMTSLTGTYTGLSTVVTEVAIAHKIMAATVHVG